MRLLGWLQLRRAPRSPHTNLQLQSDMAAMKDGVFTVYDSGFELSPTLPGGVHLLLGQQDLQFYVLELMSEHAIQATHQQIDAWRYHLPLVQKRIQRGCPCRSRSASGIRCRPRDPRAVTERLGIAYSPEAAMGKVVVQILSRLAGKRRTFRSAEYDAIVAGQGGKCACGCGVAS